MQQKLVAFIRQQITAGYDINSIKTHLLGVGYNPADINSAIAFVTGGADESIRQKIIPFISQQKHLNYDENNVRTHLIKSGYPAEIVNKAVKEVYKEHSVSTAISKQNLKIIGGIAVVIIAVIGIVMMFSGGEEDQAEAQLLDFEISSLSQAVNRGNELEFNIELTSMGSFKRYDMQITHKIYNENGRAITFKKETVAIETKVSKTTSIPIPLTAPPGRYTLESIARYNGLAAEASLEFEIEGKEEPEAEEAVEEEEDGEQVIDDLGNKTEEEEELEPIEIPEGEVTLESIEDDVKKYSAQPGKDKQAAQLCELLTENLDKDTCFLTIAQTSKKKIYCERIKNNYRKDVCYLQFSRAGDYTVCDSMMDEDLKVSCKALAARSTDLAEGEAEAEGEPLNQTNVTEELNITNITAPPVPAAEGEAEAESEGEAEPEDEEPTFQDRLVEIITLAGEDADAAKQACADMNNDIEKDQCYLAISGAITDLEICHLMSSTALSDQCYISYALRTRDGDVCEEITDEIMKSQCEMII